MCQLMLSNAHNVQLLCTVHTCTVVFGFSWGKKPNESERHVLTEHCSVWVDSCLWLNCCVVGFSNFWAPRATTLISPTGFQGAQCMHGISPAIIWPLWLFGTPLGCPCISVTSLSHHGQWTCDSQLVTKLQVLEYFCQIYPQYKGNDFTILFFRLDIPPSPLLRIFQKIHNFLWGMAFLI